MKAYTLLLPILVGLSGCLGPQIQPSTHSVSQIKTVLVLPIEAPPFEVTPDLLLTQQPSLAMLSETIPLDSVLDRKVYRGPGGVLIAGWVDESQTPRLRTRSDDGKALWMPTMVLAHHIASLLNTTNAVRASVSEGYYKLSFPDRMRGAHSGGWMADIRRWYNEDLSSVDYEQLSAGRGRVDAVLEIGLAGYSIWYEQLDLNVLMKVLDPDTKRVLGRISRPAYRREVSVPALMADEGEKLKQLVTEIGTQLATEGLDFLGWRNAPKRERL